MFLWAWKSLLSQRGSLFGGALGIASAFILVIFFDSVWRGETDQIIAYPSHIKPDVWVMQKGVGNMHMAMSFVWDWKADQIAKLPGVKRVTPILYLNSVVSAGEHDIFAFIVGLLPDAQRAGPWELSAGREIKHPGETVIPDVLSRITGVGIGDQLKITDRRFTVVGLSGGTYSSANSILFIPFADLNEILSAAGTYSFLMVDATEDTDARELAERIKNSIEKVNALPHEEFIKNDFAMASQMGVEILFMMTTICSILAALIVAFTAYSLVMRKRRELAIIKALGSKNVAIFAGVAYQACLITLAGFTLAVLFAYTIIPIIPNWVPQITIVLSLSAISQLGLIALVVAMLGALIPAYIVAHIDPASSFTT